MRWSLSGGAPSTETRVGGGGAKRHPRARPTRPTRNEEMTGRNSSSSVRLESHSLRRELAVNEIFRKVFEAGAGELAPCDSAGEPIVGERRARSPPGSWARGPRTAVTPWKAGFCGRNGGFVARERLPAGREPAFAVRRSGGSLERSRDPSSESPDPSGEVPGLRSCPGARSCVLSSFEHQQR